MHPVGPRSSGVYWVRRGLVAVVAVAVVAAIAWFVIDRGKGPAVDPAADSVTTTGSSQLTGVLKTDTSTPAPTSTGKAAPNGTKGGKAKNADAATSTGGKAAGTAKTKADDQNKAKDGKNTKVKNTKAKNGSGKAGSKGKNKAKNSKSNKDDDNSQSTTKSTGGKAKNSKKDAGQADKPAKDNTKNGAKSTGKTTATKTAATKTTPTTTTPTTTAPPPPSYDDQGRLLCPDSAISVNATTGEPSYPVGSQPILGMTVTNTGAKPCVRDLSGPLQVYTVYSKAGKRIWSTDDCFPGQGSDVRELQPGRAVPYNIKWSGTTSTPGCSTPRTQVAAGSYTLVARLGKLSSAPKPFTITG